MWAQVPTATGLTIRVINNVTKKMDVKPKFYEAFKKDGYPASFEFRQKVTFARMHALDRVPFAPDRVHRSTVPIN